MPRKYSMERRITTVDETRQRIVDATVQLHNEKGVLATSMQDIAARAGVSLGTVYRHFPTVDKLIPACGGRTFELIPPPTPDVFASLDGPDRLTAFFSALYAHYEEAERPYEVGLAEAEHIPVLRRLVEESSAYIHSLVVQAVEPLSRDKRIIALATAFADFRTWLSFTHAGFSSEGAAQTVSEILVTRRSRGRNDA